MAVTKLNTEVLTVAPSSISLVPANAKSGSLIESWLLQLPKDSADARHLQRAANELRNTDIPVAFPTETVYGLGADATRSSAVQGIYRAKQRPSDNPLIVHFHSLQQLREILRSRDGAPGEDPIPSIYLPLVEKFWPGPLTLIMPNAKDSRLAPEVTAGLSTFGARMPGNVLALALIKLADVPLAAPSANASTKPSPTAAEHVKSDLDGRISTIIDGGPCAVGVESTVVDGLSVPPVILRPGGITLEQLRSCPGWENVELAYKDAAQSETAPRAPGMKYRHYSPKAPVILYEHGTEIPQSQAVSGYVGQSESLGIIRTTTWPIACGLFAGTFSSIDTVAQGDTAHTFIRSQHDVELPGQDGQKLVRLWDIALGRTAESVAKGLFSALRELDLKNVDAILVEGLDDRQGDVASAVMNRLRKAAELHVIVEA